MGASEIQAYVLTVSDVNGSLASAKRSFERIKETAQKTWCQAVSSVCEITIANRKFEIVMEMTCKESYRLSSEEQLTAEARIKMAEIEAPLRDAFEELKKPEYMDLFNKLSKTPEAERYKVDKEIIGVVSNKLKQRGKDSALVPLAIHSIEGMREMFTDVFALYENRKEIKARFETDALKREVSACMRISDND